MAVHPCASSPPGFCWKTCVGVMKNNSWIYECWIYDFNLVFKWTLLTVVKDENSSAKCVDEVILYTGVREGFSLNSAFQTVKSIIHCNWCPSESPTM